MATESELTYIFATPHEYTTYEEGLLYMASKNNISTIVAEDEDGPTHIIFVDTEDMDQAMSLASLRLFREIMWSGNMVSGDIKLTPMDELGNLDREGSTVVAVR